MTIEQINTKIAEVKGLQAKAVETGDFAKASEFKTQLDTLNAELAKAQTSTTPSIKLEEGVNYSFTGAERAAMIAAAKAQLKSTVIGKIITLSDGKYSVTVPPEEKVHGFRNVLSNKTKKVYTLTAIKCSVRGLGDLEGKEYSFGLGQNDPLFVVPIDDWNLVLANNSYEAVVEGGRVIALSPVLTDGLEHE